MAQADSRRRQLGAVLLLAMLFSAVMASLAATGLQVAALELRMAGNEEYRLSALQLAEGMLDELQARPANFPLASEPGDIICDSTTALRDCERAGAVESIAVQPAGAGAAYRITRLGPALVPELPPYAPGSGSEGDESSEVALFEVAVEVSGTSGASGSVRLQAGIALIVSASDSEDEHSGLIPGLYRVYWREPGMDGL